MKIIKTLGNRAVVINQQENGRVSANLYVNARNGLQGADITALRFVGKTVKGAESWAAKQLAA
jgi:hypothetical protein